MGSVSALEWDNVKSYSTDNKIVTITNTFGLGEDLGTVELKTPFFYQVGVGEEVLVMEFTINSYSDYNDIIGTLKAYNVNDNNRSISKSFIIKEKQVDTLLGKNGTYYNVISWNNFTAKGLLIGETKTIGIFTETFNGEKIDIIPTIYGQSVNKWATYYANSLGVNTAYGGRPEFNGVRIVTNASLPAGTKLTRITYHCSMATANTPQLRDSSGNLLATGSAISGCNSTFDYPLVAGTAYQVGAVGDNSGTSMYWSNPNPLWSQQTGYITYIGGRSDYGGWLDDNTARNVIGITTALNTSVTVTPLLPTNNAITNSSPLISWNITPVSTNISNTSLYLFNQSYMSLVSTTNSSNGLVAYYKLDGNALDETGKNNGTFVKANGIQNITSIEGKLGGAYEFNRSVSGSFINLPNFNITTTEMTISAWIRTNSIVNQEQRFLDTYGTSGDRGYLFYINSGGTLRIIFFNASNDAVTLATTIYPNQSEWYHVVGTHKAGESIIYINNIVRDSETSLTGQMKSTINSPRIGATVSTVAPNGTIDEVMIFNRSLSANEINTLYNQSQPRYSTTVNSNNTVQINATLSNLNDAFYNWTAYANGINSSRNYVGSFSVVQSFSSDGTTPIVNITSPRQVIPTFSFGDTLNLNWTLIEVNPSFCNYRYNNINTTVSCFANTTNFTPIENVNTIYFFANDSLGAATYVNSSWTYSITESNQNYTNYAYETDNSEFTVNISTPASILSVAAYLIYNNTQTFVESNCSGGSCLITTDLDLPLVTNGFGSQNYSFFWSLSLYNGTASIPFNTTARQQNVSRIYLFANTSLSPTISLNFTTWDERNRTSLSPMSFDATFQLWLGNGQVKRNISFSNASSSQGIQLYLYPNESYYTDAFIEYNAVGIFNGSFTKRNYNFQNATISNATQNIRLFLLGNTYSTSFIQRVVTISQIAVDNALILQQRYYPGDDTYETVSITRTDGDGESIGYYEVEVPDYRHFIVKNGELLKSTDKGKIFAEATPATLIFTIGEELDNAWSSFENITSLISSLTFDEDTDIVTYTWIDTTGALSIANLTVDQRLGDVSNLPVCARSSTLVAGTLNCNLSGLNGTFVATSYIGRSPQRIDQLITFVISNIKDLLAKPFLVLWILLMCGVVGMGLFYPPAGIILSIVVMILGSIMGVLGVGWVFLWAIIAVAIWVIIETS
jgi:hypothetical protein